MDKVNENVIDESGPDGTRRQSARWWAVGPILAGVLYTILAVHAARVETPTVDEFAHVPAGCTYWKHGRLDLYCKNPPLMKLWMALPIVLDGKTTIPNVVEPTRDWGPWQYGIRFMNANRERYLDLFFRARLMVAALGLPTALLLFWWSADLFGRPAAAITTSLFLLSPNVLAHGHLGTIDIGCMFGIFLTIFAARWAYRRPSRARVATLGVALGAALLMKFTALLLLPVVIGLVLLHRLRQKARHRATAADLAIILGVALVVVNVGMGLKGTCTLLGDYTFSSAFCKRAQEWLPDALPIPLPKDYVDGFDGQKMDVEVGEFNGYLYGEWSSAGWWYYNLVVLGVKLPVPLLLTVAAGACCWPARRLGWGESLSVIAPALVLVLALSLLSRLNLGIRYLLPVVPFLFLLSGAFWGRLAIVSRRWWAGAAVFTVLWYGVILAATHPGYLSFFNIASGGPAPRRELLADSNLDWGQDLYRVRDAVAPLVGDGPIGLLYFGHVDPAIYGLNHRPLPAKPARGVMAVSVNYLLGAGYVVTTPAGEILHVRPDHAKWLRKYQPLVDLGSMLIYDTRETPMPAGG